MASFCRPNTFTMVWPVKVSSTCPLTLPVRSHWMVNCFCDRFAISMVTMTEIGTVTMQMAASIGLIQNIMPSTPSRVSTDEMICPKVCCMACWMLSMSLVTRLRMSPRGMAVEVLQREPGQLLVDVLAQRVREAPYETGHQVRREPHEQRADQVDGDDDHEHLADRAEVDALAGHDVFHAGEHVGHLVLTRRAQACHRLLLGDPGRATAC